jgi:hypothetical protein
MTKFLFIVRNQLDTLQDSIISPVLTLESLSVFPNGYHCWAILGIEPRPDRGILPFLFIIFYLFIDKGIEDVPPRQSLNFILG